MIKTYKNFVEEFRDMYNKEIMPLIQEGHYETVRSLLFNITHAMQTQKHIFNFREIPKVHCGLSLLASIQLLYDKLGEEEDFDIKRNTRNIDAYLAQTKLPTQEEVDSARQD